MKLYRLCMNFNEGHIASPVMYYTAKNQYDRFILYDNMSTDNSVDIIKSWYPEVEVRQFETDGAFNDTKRLDTIHEAILELAKYHKETFENEVGWIDIGDFDEVVYYNMPEFNIKTYLESLSYCGYNVCSENILNLLLPSQIEHLSFDKDNLSKATAPHEVNGARVIFQSPFAWQKPTLFRIDNLIDVELTEGWHFANFIYDGQQQKQFFNTKYISRFHLKHLFKTPFIWHRLEVGKRQYIMDGAPTTPYDTRTVQQLNDNWDEFYRLGIDADVYLKNKWLNGDDSDEHGHQVIMFGDYIWGKD